MPLGSSSAAPVMRPGPSRLAKLAVSFWPLSPGVVLRPRGLSLRRALHRAPRPSAAPARRAALQMLDAADVGRDDALAARARRGGRACGRAAASPARAAAPSRCRPSRSTGAPRSAATCDLEAERAQDASRPRRAAAGRAAACRADGTRRAGAAASPARRQRCDPARRRNQLGQQLGEVARQGGDAVRLVGIGRVVAQRVAVFLDRHAAARGVHHDRLDAAGRDQRPPGVDVAAHVLERRLRGRFRCRRIAPQQPASSAPRASGCRRRRARARWRC